MNIFEQLELDEGRRNLAYQDSRGIWTIGVGFNLQSTPMPDAVIDAWLRAIVADRAAELDRRAPWVKNLSEPRYGALLNLAYNLGVGGLLGFQKMLMALRESRWEDAARELLESRYATQVGLRAERLATQIRVDEWQ